MGATVAFWVIAAVVMALLEAATVSLVSIWFAVGALGAAIGAALGLGWAWQIVIFVVLSALTLVLTKPLAKKLRRRGPLPTNADRILGAEGEVIEEIDPVAGTGQVRVMGQIWSAKSADGTTIGKGTLVKVSAIEGVKAIVAPGKE